MTVQDDSQSNHWHNQQLWRYPFPHDRERAAQLRQALVELKLYPGYDLAQNPNLGVWEANRRAALPEMAAELDRTDLIAITDLVRLLVLVPRKPHFFKRRRNSKLWRV